MTTSRSSAKAPRTAYVCDACGHQPPKWVGRCSECGEWGSVIESTVTVPVSGRVVSSRMPAEPARPIAQISAAPARAVATGVGELDRVLGGGLVPGAVVLLAGEPGVGKSTLLLDVAQQWAAGAGTPSLVVSGEESVSQVRLRAERLGALHEKLYLASENDLGTVIGHLDAVRPGLLVLDSVQTVSAPGTEGVPGGVTQVRAVTAALVAIAKERGIATVLVGHVTKDGQVAGPRVLEHLVDVVLHFEGDKHSSLRLVRGVKNRFGAADEVGCFEMHEGGITSLPDPSGLFLTRYLEPVPGTCVTVAMEGRRALVTEVQALIGAEVQGSPRRTVSGLDSARLAMVLAVLERRTKQLKLYNREVFAATVGGIRLTEPSADLAMALAVASGGLDLAMAPHLVAIGEVGLTGEIRRVGAVGRRLSEAARLGFKVALVPPGCGPDGTGGAPKGMEIVEVGNLQAALQSAARASAAAQ
ncbi:DNA repair protein RadA/Sms [Actinoplanes campanulatus]|uniref:DNA repair protein RadA n=1 Tax=Actinoplanes campanulatus TaxID=113559 RepID=A0A7W5FFX4_9ACTN|nr:DNA repair protein RadA [Actinoplanes campanulatus]MBB3096939.1 DNA repair protein RadA/Sms [Actinoplanes campanulatus]GGN14566.1 DNA repair protein RadA [Actinoplanes campanulatus]GID37877.1 DNA repair protein RadA [Actinoplanes campanulatus]